MAPITPTFREEEALVREGFSCIAGVDEVGAGCWAGPVYAGAVVLPRNVELGVIRDSKLLSEKQRNEAVLRIKEHAVAWAVGEASVEEIDKLNIRRAGGLAMLRAIEQLQPSADFVLTDAFDIFGCPVPQKGIIRGDQLVMSIAAASIVAKVERDALMRQLHEQFPEYAFDAHKGYGTKKHQDALQKHGVTAVHRRSYAPVRALL